MNQRAYTPRDLNGHSFIVSGCAPPQAGPQFKVIQLDAGESVDGVILAPSVWGVITHWNEGAGVKGRSQRCTRDKGACDGCEKELPSRWKGYIHFYNFANKSEEFLEITPGAFDKLLLEAPTDRPLRGLRLRAQRSKGGKNGRLKLELGLFAGSMDAFPKTRDPEPILEILWNWGR